MEVFFYRKVSHILLGRLLVKFVMGHNIEHSLLNDMWPLKALTDAL